MLALCAPRVPRLNLYPSLPRYKNRHHQPESVCKIIPLLRSLSAQPGKVFKKFATKHPWFPGGTPHPSRNRAGMPGDSNLLL